MSNLSFEISHLTGKTTWILSALQGLFPSSDWFDLKFRWKISKSYISNIHRNFLWNNYFLSNFCFVICHLTGKCLRSFAISCLSRFMDFTRNSSFHIKNMTKKKWQSTEFTVKPKTMIKHKGWNVKNQNSIMYSCFVLFLVCCIHAYANIYFKTT